MDSLKSALEQKVASRIWAGDVSLWESDPNSEGAKEAAQRLGWLRVAEAMLPQVPQLLAFAAELKAEGYTNALVLGMGGSSLCPLVLAETFPTSALRVDVLDSTDPSAVMHYTPRSHSLESDIQWHEEGFFGLDPKTTLYVVSSKSGTTTEPLAFYAHFRAVADKQLKDEAGSHFAAITDPSTKLAQLAQSAGFRRTFENPPDIGGRYSALSYFGLVPAALQGLDVEELLKRAIAMGKRCQEDSPDNPGLSLGAVLAEHARAGRDKVTLLPSAGIASLGLWLEQLIAESTGKGGKGLVPVAGEPLGGPEVYSPDRVFVSVRLKGEDDAETALAALEAAGHPVLRLEMADKLDLGAEFFRWEFAIAVACHELGVNAFDQPNVEEAKQATKRLLGARNQNGQLPEPPLMSLQGGVSVLGEAPMLEEVAGLPEGRGHGFGAFRGPESDAVAQALAAWLSLARPGDYLAIMAYAAPTAANADVLEDLRVLLRGLTRCATTVGFGPRFLHSTGQLHKGGPNSCVFLQLICEDPFEVEVPGTDYSFSILKRAQALGDREALLRAGRRGISLNLPPQEPQGIAGVTAAAALLAGRSASPNP